MSRPRIPNRRLMAALAAGAVVATLLSGCVSWFFPPQPSTTSTPTGEQVDAALQPFYSQVLVWRGCGGGMQCTTAEAPMNWDDPAQATIELALVRQPATGQRLGSLLVNPGGPGGSGYDFVLDSVDYATSDRLQGSFDIVGFDPRGVGHSSAVSCYDDPAFLDEFNYGIVPGEYGSDEWIANLAQVNKQFGEACLEFTGPLLQYVDTISAARDLDLLRAVLGDKKLNYLGYSYGTYLHLGKDRVYGDSWRRRGEMMSILPNLARKVDRLMLGRASASPAVEDLLDTTADLFVYAAKYKTFLLDATQAPLPVGASSWADGTAGVDEVIASLDWAITEHGDSPLPRIEAILEEIYQSIGDGAPGGSRLSLAEELVSKSQALLLSTIGASPSITMSIVRSW